MKKLILAMSVLVAVTSAHAARIEWSEITQAEIAYVKGNPTVKTRVASLRGAGFQVAETVNNVFSVVTNNGCSFKARIAYGEYGFNPALKDSGIKAIQLSKSACK